MLRQQVFSDFTQEEEEKMASDQQAVQRGLRLHLTHGLLFLLKTAAVWFGSSHFDAEAKVYW